MASSKFKSPPLTLITATFIAISAAVAGLLVYMLINGRVQNFQEAALATAVETRARGAQLAFQRALYREWSNLSAVANQVNSTSPQDLQSKLDMLAGDGTVISWAGYAANDGTVKAASNNMLRDANVSSRPWFQRGLEGNFAGDVHEAVLLASLLPAPEGEPLRFIDLATPIRNTNQTTVGVLGLHINFGWARSYIKEVAAALGVELFLVNANGEAIIATDGGAYSNLDLPSFRTAAAGAEGVNVEKWPDGRTYFAATLPELAYKDLPKFGWNVIARIDANTLLEEKRSFSAALAVGLAALGALLVLLSLLFIVVFVLPFQHLARNAQKIAAGKDVYPYESRRTWELAAIGSALARLQAAANVERGSSEN